MQTIGNIIKTFKTELNGIYPPNEIQAISELVLEHYGHFSKTDLILKTNEVIDKQLLNQIEEVLKRLKNHEPVQYILGQCRFYDCFFIVNHHVLIPRPETEELVDLIVKENIEFPDLKILDVGTGSGCIAITLAKNLKHADLYACDISSEALKTAVKNAKLNEVCVNFFKMNILSPDDRVGNQLFDIIVSNPPYVLMKEKALMHKNVTDFEPWQALFVDDSDPLLFYKAIISYAKSNLKMPGSLYFEINEALGQPVAELLKESGFDKIRINKDINGKDRVVCGKKQTL